MPRIIKKELLEFKYSWKELIRAVWFLLGLAGARRRYFVGIILLFIVSIYTVVPSLILGSAINYRARRNSAWRLPELFVKIARF